jgi:uncharacterized coiled-coil DUF342 family protein
MTIRDAIVTFFKDTDKVDNGHVSFNDDGSIYVDAVFRIDDLVEAIEATQDANDLDDVVRELGIEDSFTTPADAVRGLKAEIEALRAELAEAKERCKAAEELVLTPAGNIYAKLAEANAERDAMREQLDLNPGQR